MAIRTIKDQVVTQLKAITKLVIVTEDPNLIDPTFEECPTAIVSYDDPWVEARPVANGAGIYQYLWHFDISILITPIGVGNLDEWIQAAEPFPALLVAQFAGHNTLSNTATSIVFDDVFPRPTVLPAYRNQQYFGFHFKLSVFENISTTYTP